MPPVLGQRATIISRYHLMFAVPSRNTASLGADTPYRDNGRTRHIPTCPVRAFRRLLRDVFTRTVLSSFHLSRGSLCRCRGVLLLPFITVTLSSCHYCIRFFRFVNTYFRNMKIIYKSCSPEESIPSFRREISPPATTAPPRLAAWFPSHGCRR